MCWDVRVRYEGCSNGSHGNEEIGPEVCAQTGNKACCSSEWDLLLDVEIEAIELVDGNDGVKRNVVCLKLLNRSAAVARQPHGTHALIVSTKPLESALRSAAQHAQHLHATALQPAHLTP